MNEQQKLVHVSSEASAEDAGAKGCLVRELNVNVTSGNEAASIDSSTHRVTANDPPVCSKKFWEEYSVQLHFMRF
jgi:hypothetical protein